LEQISWEDEVRQKIDSLVQLEVLPELQKLADAQRIIWEKVFGESIKAVFSPKAVTPLVVASMLIFAPLPYLDTLRFGTTELVLGASSLAISNLLPKLIDLALEERQRRRHSLFYLANIK
jgi:hypothetical protein